MMRWLAVALLTVAVSGGCVTRETRPLPVMKLNPEVKSLFDFTYDDFELQGYDPHPPIKAEVSV